MVGVGQTVSLSPEEEAKHVRFQIGPPHIFLHAPAYVIDELSGRRASREVQGSLLTPRFAGVFVERALGTQPLENLHRLGFREVFGCRNF